MSEENWYPSEEEYTPNLSKDDWIRLLQDEKIFDYNSMCLMRRLKDIGGQATCKQLADKYGKTPSAYVAYEKALAKRILDNSNCNAPENVSRFSILFLGKWDSDNIHYIWKLRPKLSAALDEIDLAKYELYEEKNKMNLQEIYEKQGWYYTDWFPRYEKQVNRFVVAIKNNTCDDEVKKDLIYTQDNSIANAGQWGMIYNTDKNPEYDNLLERWDELYSILKNIVDVNDCTNKQFNQIRQIFKECCNKEKKLAANRTIAALLPNVLTTTVNEDDFYYLLKKMKSIFNDYPPITKNWLEDNKSFIKYVNKEVQFKHPWHSSIFAWCLKEYFEMIDEQNKNKQKEQQKEMERIEHYKKLLQANHNLILTGAPGTGKTHLAKEIAKAMGCTDDEIGFVQFHPSYDYTDFVEGLRPKNDDNGNVGFERRDGVFKKFCKNALSKTNITKGNFDDAYEKFIKEIIENEEFSLHTESRKKKFVMSLNSKNSICVTAIKGNTSMCITKERIKQYIETGKTNWYIYTKIIGDYIKKRYNIEVEQKTETNKKNPYVFIIDEINRGEISKIFGELFFSIDPGYRGLDGKVQTQYQNLVEEGDEFFNGFYVPENVYIIGTMNDIDRSVESMDFAFRRRFAFCEIMASENVGMLDAIGDLKDDAVNRMERLNKKIEQIEGLSSAYHIGASYFLKLQNYDGDFDGLWKYHIEGLLREYLRGNPEIETLIGDLKSAYDNENQIAEKQDAKNQVEETE